MTSRRKESDKDIERDFNVLLNMSARELDDWLETAESKSVGWHHEGETEVRRPSIWPAYHRDSTKQQPHRRRPCPHAKGRHLAKRPHHNVEHTRWRYSLTNWGHDPLKK
jgi:hypothetical protein